MYKIFHLEMEAYVYLSANQDVLSISLIPLPWCYKYNNPFTRRVPLEIIVSYSPTFENNLGIKRNFSKYLNNSYCVASDKQFSFKCFQKNAFVSKIFPKSFDLFWLLWVLMG